MKIFMLMSWRNLWRNKRRSLVVISTVAICIFAINMVSGFTNGFNEQLVENMINTSLGHVAVHRKGFHNNMEIQFSFIPLPSLYAAIKGAGPVVSFTPRVKVQGMIRSSEASRGVMVMGIDPEKEKRVSQIYRYTERGDGSAFLDDPAEDAILISRSLAKKLDLVLGDRLVLMLQDRKGQIIGAGLKVKGFFVTPLESIDRHVVYVGIAKMQEITGLGKKITEINTIAADRGRAEEVKQSIVNSIGYRDLEVLSWKDRAPNIVQMIDLADNIVLIFLVIIFIAVIFTIINTMIMAIMERFHEIGVMKSIGTTPSRIFGMVVFESVNLSLIGLCAGMAIGAALIFVLAKTGIDLSAYAGNLKNWGTGSIIYPSLKPADLVSSSTVVIITAVVASLYPAAKAARIKPLEALHFI